jgi:hypothetical protein
MYTTKRATSYRPVLKWFNQSAFTERAAEEAIWLARMGVGERGGLQWGQAFMKWWGVYNQSHPEYFALQADGTRRPLNVEEPERVKVGGL